MHTRTAALLLLALPLVAASCAKDEPPTVTRTVRPGPRKAAAPAPSPAPTPAPAAKGGAAATDTATAPTKPAQEAASNSAGPNSGAAAVEQDTADIAGVAFRLAEVNDLLEQAGQTGVPGKRADTRALEQEKGRLEQQLQQYLSGGTTQAK